MTLICRNVKLHSERCWENKDRMKWRGSSENALILLMTPTPHSFFTQKWKTEKKTSYKNRNVMDSGIFSMGSSRTPLPGLKLRLLNEKQPGGVCWRFSAFWGFVSHFPDGDLIGFKAFNLNVTKVSKNLSTFISFINNKSVTDKIKQISHSIFCSFHGCNDLFSPDGDSV